MHQGRSPRNCLRRGVRGRVLQGKCHFLQRKPNAGHRHDFQLALGREARRSGMSESDFDELVKQAVSRLSMPDCDGPEIKRNFTDAYRFAVGGICGFWEYNSNKIMYCYSAGVVSSGKGIVGGLSSSASYRPVICYNCVTTSGELGDDKSEFNKSNDYVNITDINSKVEIFNGAEMYFPNRVWDTETYPANCTILLWQGSNFSVQVTSD